MAVEPIFLSLGAQHLLFAVIHAIFGVSVTFHAISILFLVKFTPPSQTAWRKYMLYIQGWLIAQDVYLAVLLAPVPLFPAPVGFLAGLLCDWRVPVPIQGGLAVLAVAESGVAILLCLLHKHQSILFVNDRFRLGKRANRAVHVIMVVICIFPPVCFGASSMDTLETDEFFKTDPRNLTWVTKRGCYFYMEKGPFQSAFIGFTLMAIIIFTIYLTFSIMYINYVLRKRSHQRSTRSIKNTRKSVKRLFIQLFTPLLLLAIPGAILFIAFGLDGLISFEQCLAAYTVLYLHPITHNILLLLLTPAFRKTIIRSLRSIFNRSCSKDNEVREVKSVSKWFTKYSTQ